MVKWGFAGVGILLVFIWSLILGLQLMGSTNGTVAILETDVSKNSGRYLVSVPESRNQSFGDSFTGEESLALVHEGKEDLPYLMAYEENKDNHQLSAEVSGMSGHGKNDMESSYLTGGSAETEGEVSSSEKIPVDLNINAMEGMELLSGISGEVKEIRKKDVEVRKRPLLKEIRFDDSSGRLVIIAGAAIHDVKTFTLENPRRIVLDLNNMESPYRSEQRMDLDSMHISSVRHFAHEDRVRIVLDMQEGWKGSYQKEPIDSGLEVVLVLMDIP
ncbi:AMIN domain-containing protein [Desulfobotulus mexicanus]|uniref:AMIN domain-containing protein n=1 Tax=Desulfobotulus mexicanus TaxID=2586642 RepID=A0A5S5MCF6_9BACT|nr:AMIN domain-containing protein [Desulfobotulus mexicanus]TYT73394.1 AMIN domain-containing protein [Desulfobotulus mexicanus]